MQIGNVSFIAPNTPLMQRTVTSNSAIASPATTASPVPAQGLSSANPAPATAAPRTEPAPSIPRVPAPEAQTAGEAAFAEDLRITGYSMTVKGTQYSGSVEDSNNEYTGSIPNLAGAAATGSSAYAAEINLGVRIDELV